VTDYFSYLPYIAFAAIAVGLIGLALSWRQPRQAQQVDAEPGEVVTDWRPTGKIDFPQTGSDAAPRFYLQTEEYRVLQTVSGTKHVEVRWRPATLDEAKRVARWNNSRETILGLPLTEPVRAATLVPGDMQADEHPPVSERRH
jgi:hypothetical protein